MFLWLVDLVTTAGIISWIVLSATYLRFFNALREQGISRDRLPYKSPLQPYLTVATIRDYITAMINLLDFFLKYFALAMNSLVLVTSGWTSFIGGFNPTMFFTNYLDW